jgi:hypothetical protein
MGKSSQFKLGWLAGMALIVVAFLVGAVTRELWAEVSEEEPPRPVHVVVDFDDGVEKHFTRIPWREGMTVADALDSASEHPRGIEFELRGSGATAFVRSIDDLSGEGFSGKKRNWLFQVNGRTADRGCGVWKLDAGDQVLWRFTDKLPQR